MLRRLRDAVFRPPLERPLTFPFVPHVTLADEMAPDRIAAARRRPRRTSWPTRVFERVHLLQELRHGHGPRRWEPVADAPFAPKIVVGRGGVELELGVSLLLDPEAVEFETGAGPPGGSAAP